MDRSGLDPATARERAYAHELMVAAAWKVVKTGPDSATDAEMRQRALAHWF